MSRAIVYPHKLGAIKATEQKYNYKKVKKATKLLLEGIGEDPNRDGLLDTPDRVAKMYYEILSGYDQSPDEFLKEFDNVGDYHGPIIERNIPFYAFCEHHLSLFPGKLTLGYCPENKIVGLSKLVRMARVYAKRLQTQENLTMQISNALSEHLNPIWCAVRIEAEHYCMSIRGVRAPGVTTSTVHGHGDYPKDVFHG